MTAEAILNKAINIINGKRAENNGRSERNFTLIAEAWSDYLGTKVDEEDVCMMMADLKRVRVKTGYAVEDSFVDMVAYTALAAEYATDGADVVMELKL